MAASAAFFETGAEGGGDDDPFGDAGAAGADCGETALADDALQTRKAAPARMSARTRRRRAGLILCGC